MRFYCSECHHLRVNEDPIEVHEGMIYRYICAKCYEKQQKNGENCVSKMEKFLTFFDKKVTRFNKFDKKSEVKDGENVKNRGQMSKK